MIFIWLFSCIAFFALLGVGYFPFLELQGSDSMLFLSLGLMAISPWIIYIVPQISLEKRGEYFLLSKKAFLGYFFLIILGLFASFFLDVSSISLFFILFFLASIYFALDSRLFFTGALGCLFIVVISLITGVDVLAEQASISLYYLLVCGVFLEMTHTFFLSFHRGSSPLFQISKQFLIAYISSLREYFYLASYVLAFLFLFALGAKSLGVSVSYEALPFLIFGYWAIFGITALFYQSDFHKKSFFQRDISFLKKYIPSRIIVHSFIAFFVALAVDGIFFVSLPFLIQAGFFCLFFVFALLLQYIASSSLFRKVFSI